MLLKKAKMSLYFFCSYNALIWQKNLIYSVLLLFEVLQAVVNFLSEQEQFSLFQARHKPFDAGDSGGAAQEAELEVLLHEVVQTHGQGGPDGLNVL